MRTWKKAVVCFFVLVFFFITATSVSASEVEKRSDQQIYQEQYDKSGIAQLPEHLPQETRDFLNGLGVSSPDWKEIFSVSPQKFFSNAWQLVQEKAKQPLKAAASLMGIILLCALVSGFKISFGENQLGGAVGMAGTLCACTVLIGPLVSCIASAAKVIQASAGFLLAGVPILSGILVACGKPVSASGYSLFVLAAGNFISLISAVFLIPVLHIFLAFSIVSAISPQIHLSGLCEAFAKTVRWILVFSVTIFTSLLSLQTVVASSADTTAVRTAKFIVGSFVPIVGGALSDAISTVHGCVGLLKSGTGAFGLLAALCAFLPVSLECVLWIITCMLCAAVGDIFGLSAITSILRASQSVLQTLLAIIITCASIMMVSAAFVLQGGGT